MRWAAEIIRPDIVFDTRELSTNNNKATYQDARAANRQLKKLQDAEVYAVFSKLRSIKDLCLILFTDAAFKSNSDKEKNVAGKIILSQNDETQIKGEDMIRKIDHDTRIKQMLAQRARSSEDAVFATGDDVLYTEVKNTSGRGLQKSQTLTE